MLTGFYCCKFKLNNQRIMKNIIVISLAIVMILSLNPELKAQTYDYTIDWDDTSTYKVSCGKVVSAQWSVKDTSCEMTTPYLRSETEAGCTLFFNVKVNQSGSAGPSDKCYFYHKLNHEDWVLDSLIYAGADPGVHSYNFNLFLIYGYYVQFKICMATNSNNEFWAIKGGDMQISDGDSSAHNISTWTNEPPDPTTLPVELILFNGCIINGSVELNWITVSETNNDYFIIERSTDGINFEKIGFVYGAGNSNNILVYKYFDFFPIDVAYYRLKQTDFNGKYTYSKIVMIDFTRQYNDVVNIYPNPFNSSTNIVINDASQNKNFELVIYNIFGKEVINTTINKQSTTLETYNLPSGIYTYKVIEKNQTIQSGKLTSLNK